MFKIAFLLFIALVRGQTPLPDETITAKYAVVENAPPAGRTNTCPGTVWNSHSADAEPGNGDHDKPYYAVLSGGTGAVEASERCGEMFALFETGSTFEETLAYIIVAASEKIDSPKLEIGDLACSAIAQTCATPFGVALKLPRITPLPLGSAVTMCDDWNMEDSGDGTENTPYYVYVYDTSTQKLFAGLEHCGRVYQFGDKGAEKYVVVAGVTEGKAGDGLELVVRKEECDTLDDCGLKGYAIWTGETFAPSTTPEKTDSPSESTSPSETTTPSETSPDLTTGSPEDSTFFAGVGLTLFALLA